MVNYRERSFFKPTKNVSLFSIRVSPTISQDNVGRAIILESGALHLPIIISRPMAKGGHNNRKLTMIVFFY